MAAPKFEEIATQLVAQIKSGMYSSAQRLPSEYDLANDFSVSRLTIRKAIDMLIRAQLLVKDPGKGTYVMSGQNNEKVESGRLGLQGFTEAAVAYGKTSRTEVLSFKPLTKPSKVVQEQLNLVNRVHPEVDELIRKRFWDDEPMTIEHIVVCHEYVADCQAKDFEGSLFTLLAKSVDIAYSHQEIGAILVDQEMADLLQIPVGNPLLQVYSVTYTADAKTIFYDTSYYRADKYTFKSTLTRFDH